MNISGFAKSGEKVSASYDLPLFGLGIEDRIDIFRACSPIFGVVSGRMNRIAGYKWKVIPDGKRDDEIAEYMKSLKDIYDEYGALNGIKAATVKNQIVTQIRYNLKDCLPDLSNFNQSLMRWYRKIKGKKQRSAQEVEDWLMEPNIEDKWEDFVKKWTFDLLVHGTSAIYKEELGGMLENFYVLPGGSMLPLRQKYVGG
jgi:hypothetical protein